MSNFDYQGSENLDPNTRIRLGKCRKIKSETNEYPA